MLNPLTDALFGYKTFSSFAIDLDSRVTNRGLKYGGGGSWGRV